ncbi:MAG: aspartyl protease family protein [Gemmatimonadaceae bacterium]
MNSRAMAEQWNRRVEGHPQRRIKVSLATSAVALLLLAACVPPRPLVITARPAIEANRPDQRHAPKPALRFYDTYWDALADANLQSAWIVAESSEQRTLADAIDAFMNGRDTEADSAVRTILGAKDSQVRSAARITYGAILSSEGDWSRLATYVAAADREKRDAAGVESWAPAFRNVSTSITFADTLSELPLTRSVTGVAIIPVSVNGVKRHFWLDTGTSITILTNSVADAAKVVGMGSDTLEMVSAVGRVSTRSAVVRSLKLGQVAVTNAPAMIVSDLALQIREKESGMPPVPIDGVIGFDVIRKLDLTIDDEDGRVIIRKPSLRTLDDSHPRNLAWFGIPIATLLSKNGSAIHLLLDTGAGETFGTPGMAQKSGAHWRAAERRTVQGFGGTKVETGIVIPEVQLFLGTTPLSFKRIFLYGATYPTIFKLDGTLGSDIGRGGTVRIDMTNGRLDISGK